MKGLVVENRALNDSYFLLKIHSEEVLDNVKPGQFIMINTNRYSYTYDPLLRRPFSIADFSEQVLTIIYKVVGKGTSILKDFNRSDEINFSSNLGNGFSLMENGNVALVGGGVGIAPLLFLSKTLKSLNNEITLFYGGRNKDEIILLNEFERYCDEIVVSTDDGSMGGKGLITEFLHGEYDKIYTCGPKLMMKKVVEMAESKGMDVEVSMEERMACGVGACLGCIVYINDDNGIIQKRCCVEGSVFDGKKVIWE